jgi:hypothetical protein
MIAVDISADSESPWKKPVRTYFRREAQDGNSSDSSGSRAVGPNGAPQHRSVELTPESRPMQDDNRAPASSPQPAGAFSFFIGCSATSPRTKSATSSSCSEHLTLLIAYYVLKTVREPLIRKPAAHSSRRTSGAQAATLLLDAAVARLPLTARAQAGHPGEHRMIACISFLLHRPRRRRSSASFYSCRDLQPDADRAVLVVCQRHPQVRDRVSR